jgi:hypothetical protein
MKCGYTIIIFKRHQNMQWKLLGLSSAKNFKPDLSAGKLLLTIFWDPQGPISEHYYLKRGQTW